MPEMPADAATAIGRIPSGCAILTARDETTSTAMLASWVQQAAFEPPIVTVAVKTGRPIGDLIESSGGFVLNILGEDPGAMFKHFGKGFGPGEEAFAGLATTDVPYGVAIPDRIARLSCKLHSKQAVGDHVVYFGEVVEADTDETLPAPCVHIRKSGAGY